MVTKVLKRVQFLPTPVETAWDFFSTPLNLSKIKPSDMRFKILSELPDRIYPGLFIHYKVAPIWNIPILWTTEITQVAKERYFIDEQRKGPFRMWHHEHHFEAVDGGVLMTDVLHYNVGKWLLGVFASALFVDAKVKWIFDYRSKKLDHLFSKA